MNDMKLNLRRLGTEPPKRKNPLLVLTVFAGHDEHQRQWFELQQRFLAETTSRFDHVTFMWGEPPTDPFFTNRTTFITRPNPPDCHRTQHVTGLRHLFHFSLSNRSSYKNFLFLDSDAFPIRKGWLTKLVGVLGSRFGIATPVRAENLEKRFHPSVVFVRNWALSKLSFDIRSLNVGWLLGEERDVSIGEVDDVEKVLFPLMRSNRVNIHPFYCGVYFDMFFHHGAGSRTKSLYNSRQYWEVITDLETTDLTDRLIRAPGEFVSMLAGWNPKLYPDILSTDDT